MSPYGRYLIFGDSPDADGEELQPVFYFGIVHGGEISVKKSSRSVSRVLFSVPKRRVSVIYLRSLSPVSSSGLPSDVGRATLVNAGLHDLTTPKMHSPHIAIRLVGSYPTFSPLPLRCGQAVIFFCITLPLQAAFC